MKFIARLKRIAQARGKARERYRTYRLIQNLPPEIRKDIGWPDGDRARNFIGKSR